MPIHIDVRDYAWRQTEAELIISIPMKGVNRDKVDIFSTNDYIKVSFAPFIFELFYSAEIDDEESASSIGGGLVSLRLKKKEQKMWDTLEKPGTSRSSQDIKLKKIPPPAENMSKQQIQELREIAIKEAEARLVVVQKLRADRQEKERREAVKQQIEADDADRSRKAAARKAVTDDAMAELNEWRKLKGGERTTSSRSRSKVEAAEQDHTLTAVRPAGNIKVFFTERVFPTPLRESKVEQEEEWLKKQNEAAKAQKEFEEDNKDFTEKDPLWLKDKGNEFYMQQDYPSAINAYSCGIRRGGKLPAGCSLFSNRAACHLHQCNYVECAKDCSKALELLNPPVDDNLRARIVALVRRATALVQLNMLPEALKDYQDALKLDPTDAAVKEAEHRIRAAIQGST